MKKALSVFLFLFIAIGVLSTWPVSNTMVTGMWLGEYGEENPGWRVRLTFLDDGRLITMWEKLIEENWIITDEFIGKYKMQSKGRKYLLIFEYDSESTISELMFSDNRKTFQLIAEDLHSPMYRKL